MTDAPFTETHRATLQAWLDIPVPTYPTPCGPLDSAIRAALAEIDRLTALNEHLMQALKIPGRIVDALRSSAPEVEG